MYLVDTNVFLEVLLTQERREICRNFLDVNVGELYISDFSLHSIEVILFRSGREDIFQEFIRDVVPNIRIAALPKRLYGDLIEIKRGLGLDLDDTYQYRVAKEYDLEIVTMDRDFEKIRDDVNVRFLQDTA